MEQDIKHSSDSLTRSVKLLRLDSLPKEMVEKMNREQKDCLVFGVKKFKVIGEPKVQTFQTSTITKGGGLMYGGGASRSLGENWGIFGGVGAIDINQFSVNAFRTDIHLWLEEPGKHEKIFLEKSVSLPITISIASGDEIELYFARGGFPKPLMTSDFYLSDWTPFFIKSLETQQIIPLSPLPPMTRPIKIERILHIIFFLLGALFLSAGIGLLFDGPPPSSGSTIAPGIFGLVVGILFFIPVIDVLVFNRRSKKKGLAAYQEAKEFASKFYNSAL